MAITSFFLRFISKIEHVGGKGQKEVQRGNLKTDSPLSLEPEGLGLDLRTLRPPPELRSRVLCPAD